MPVSGSLRKHGRRASQIVSQASGLIPNTILVMAVKLSVSMDSDRLISRCAWAGAWAGESEVVRLRVCAERGVSGLFASASGGKVR